MTPNIIVTGGFRSGKDALGAYLVDRYGYTRFAFADAMKRMYHELFGPADPAVKVRDNYIWFGETMRQRDPHVWIRKLAEKIEREQVFPAVITDMRFPLEHQWARSHGYTIIRVNCPVELRVARSIAAGDLFDESVLTDISESYVDGFDVDHQIDNDGTLDDLCERVDAVLRQTNGGERT